MKFSELYERLHAEGYASLVRRGSLTLEAGDVQLAQISDSWRVCSTERGMVTSEYLSTRNELEACAFFYDFMKGNMWHVKTFHDSASADALERNLLVQDIKVWRNDIPAFNGPGDARYRVFVAGRDLKRTAAIVSGLGPE